MKQLILFRRQTNKHLRTKPFLNIKAIIENIKAKQLYNNPLKYKWNGSGIMAIKMKIELGPGRGNKTNIPAGTNWCYLFVIIGH